MWEESQQKHTGNLYEVFDDLCSSGDVRFTTDFSDHPEHFLVRQLQQNNHISSYTVFKEYISS